MPWPGNSPGKNPIEILWDALKDAIQKVPITNKIPLMKFVSGFILKNKVLVCISK